MGSPLSIDPGQGERLADYLNEHITDSSTLEIPRVDVRLLLKTNEKDNIGREFENTTIIAKYIGPINVSGEGKSDEISPIWYHVSSPDESFKLYVPHNEEWRPLNHSVITRPFSFWPLGVKQGKAIPGGIPLDIMITPLDEMDYRDQRQIPMKEKPPAEALNKNLLLYLWLKHPQTGKPDGSPYELIQYEGSIEDLIANNDVYSGNPRRVIGSLNEYGAPDDQLECDLQIIGSGGWRTGTTRATIHSLYVGDKVNFGMRIQLHT